MLLLPVIRCGYEPLKIKDSNNCTDSIVIKPYQSQHITFSVDDNRDGLYSLVGFNVQQRWECYYYDLGEHGWNCQWKGITLRLDEHLFIKIFGKLKVLNSDSGKARYHEESEMLYAGEYKR